MRNEAVKKLCNLTGSQLLWLADANASKWLKFANRYASSANFSTPLACCLRKAFRSIHNFLSVLMLVSLLAATLLFAHNETETLEDHFVFETKVLHFVGSKVKKQALKSHLLYGKQKGAHNFIVDLKKAYVTTKLPKNLHVEKVGVQYRYAQEGWGVMAGVLYINDRLNEAADDVKVLTLGAHYKNWHLHLHRTTYSTFWIDQEEVQYFPKLLGVKAVLFGAVQHLHGLQKSAFSNNAQRRYVSGGAIVHAQKAGLHWGGGVLLGKNAFRVVQKGLDIRHHAFEFRYNLFASVGKRFGEGIAHVKLYHAKATELPFDNDGVKLYGIGFDFSKRF